MQDENIRRLLHYSISDRYGGALMSSRMKLRHFAILPHTNSPQIDELTEQSLGRLGTRTLWVDLKKIPKLFGTLYGEKAWREVYY